MHIAIVTDTHFGARADSREFLDYFTRFYREIFWPEIKKRKITKVLHLGDIVDRRKYINFVTLNVLRKEFIEYAESNNISLDIIVGNHDIPFRNTNSINAIGEAFAGKSHVKLLAEPTEINYDGLSVLLMPWINNTNYSESMEYMKKTTAQVLFGHLEIKGFEMYRGLPSHEGMEPAIFDKFDIVGTGHFHKKSTQGNIHYLGAPYEITWGDYDCPRGFHIFDTETRTFEYIRNPLKMFHKLWYDDTNKTFEEIQSQSFSHISNSYVKVIIQNKNNPYWFDKWLDQIYKASPLEVTIVEDHRNANILSDEEIINSAEDTPTVIHKFIQSMETKVDKNELDSLLKTLYNEAINLEVVDEKTD